VGRGEEEEERKRKGGKGARGHLVTSNCCCLCAEGSTDSPSVGAVCCCGSCKLHQHPSYEAEGVD
jgi:hypothetical protein